MANKIEKGSKAYGIITAMVYIILGVLFIVALIDVNTILSYIVGIALMVAALVFIIIDLLAVKEITANTIVTSSFLMAVGLVVVIYKLAFIQYLSMLVLVLGALLIIEGIIWLVKKKAMYASIAVLVLGAVALTFGICFFAIDGFERYCTLVLGIVLVVLGVIYLIEAISGKKLIKG